MARPKITITCSWCGRNFEVSVWVGLFAPSWFAPKHCNRHCEGNEKRAKQLAEAFKRHFLTQIRGETIFTIPSASHSYFNHFKEMIAWPDWSPRGRKTTSEGQ